MGFGSKILDRRGFGVCAGKVEEMLRTSVRIRPDTRFGGGGPHNAVIHKLAANACKVPAELLD